MTTEEKLQNFYNHSLDSANREAERVIGDHQKALDKIFEDSYLPIFLQWHLYHYQKAMS